jgi:nucleoside diphosphate kinase
MGNGASAGISAAAQAASADELKAAVSGLSDEAKAKLRTALDGGAAKTQSAFVFIKPHANFDAVKKLVQDKFAAVGIKILSDGRIDGPTIDSKKYIDQHYYAIASKATLMAPKELNVPTETFKEFFGEEWATVLTEERALNAIELQKKTGWDSATLDAKWDATNDGKRKKFGGGFYCGAVEVEEGKPPVYTFNAFFMSMRGKFTSADAAVHYFVVEFDPAKLSWADFRGKVLGPTNPADAPADSLRGQLYANWEALGLKSQPNTGDNGVHASASPFEGFAERTNWLGSAITEDVFGKVLLAEGIPEATLKAWSVDPQVVLPGGDGKKGSLFDQVEDTDLDECLAKLKAIHAAQA